MRKKGYDGGSKECFLDTKQFTYKPVINCRKSSIAG